MLKRKILIHLMKNDVNLKLNDVPSYMYSVYYVCVVHLLLVIYIFRKSLGNILTYLL